MDTEKIRETAEGFYKSASEPNSIGFLHDFHDFLVRLQTDPSWTDKDVEEVRELVFRMISERKSDRKRNSQETITEDNEFLRRKVRIESGESP